MHQPDRYYYRSTQSLNSSYSNVDGVLFNKSQTTLIAYPAGKGARYAIPTSVTNIGNYSFDGCVSLTNVTIPNGLVSIGSSESKGSMTESRVSSVPVRSGA